MDRTTATKFVLYANALFLIIGTAVQALDSGSKNVIMSGLFLAWMVTLAWHIYTSNKSESLE